MRGVVCALLLWLCTAPLLGASIDEARSLIDDGRYAEARGILEQSVNTSALEADRLLLLTRVCNELRDYEDGIRYGKEAIKLLPESSDAHLAYAVAVRIKMTAVSKVKAMFSLGTYKKEVQRALELEPNNLDARDEEIGFLVTAPGVAGGNLGKARERTAELKALDWRRGMSAQAQIELKDGNDEAAVAAMREVLGKYPNDTNVRFQLAFWLQQNERFEEADREFAILQKSDEPRLSMSALYQRGRTRVLGEYEQEQAVGLMQQYIDSLPHGLEGLPGKHSAYWRMGNAYEQLGRIEQARQAYEASLALEQNDDARKALKALAKR